MKAGKIIRDCEGEVIAAMCMLRKAVKDAVMAEAMLILN